MTDLGPSPYTARTGGRCEQAVTRSVAAVSRYGLADPRNSRHYEVGVTARRHWTNHLQSPLNPLRDGADGARRVRVAMSVLGGEVSHREQVSSSRSNHVVKHLIPNYHRTKQIKTVRYKIATKHIWPLRPPKGKSRS